MPLLQKVLCAWIVCAGVVLLIRGRPLVPGPRGLPPDPAWLTQSHGLSLLLFVAGIAAGSGLTYVLLIASMLVLLVPRIVVSRKRRF